MKGFGERHVIKNANEYPGHDYVWTINYIKDYKKNNKVIVDVGCGTGIGISFISNQIGKNVIGVDYSFSALAHAKNIFKNQKIVPNFVTTDCHFLAFKDNSVDIIISMGVFEHLQYPDKFLQETRRVLIENGLLIFTTLNKNFSFPGLEKPMNLYHVKEYTYSELKSILNKFYKKIEIYALHITGDYIDKVKKYRQNFRYRLVARLVQLEIFRKIFKITPVKLRHTALGIPTLITSYDNYMLTQNNFDNSAQFNVIARNSN